MTPAHQAHAGGVPGRTPGTWYAHDITTNDHRPIWHSEVRADAGPSAYQTIALCRSVGYQRQDAEYIALACNSFGPLVEALERLTACASEGPALCANCRDFGLAVISAARGGTS